VIRTFSAPGKLVLCGEYAALEGRPAVVAAVDRRARATRQESEEGAGLRVRGNDPRWLTVTPALLSRPAAAAEEADQPLLLAVLRELAARELPLPAARISVSTADFSAGGAKLGLGSSAAAAVAFTAALLPDADVEQLHDVARSAHRAFQGGGSGIDVAASAYGGILRFEGGSVAPAPPLPSSIDVVVAFSGIPAKTQGFVDAWRALLDRARHVQSIDAATTAFLAAATAGDGAALIAAVDEARRAMAAMGEAAGIDVVTGEHRRIADLAAALGAAAKPSGAGGGDIAICFVPMPARRDLEQALEEAGFPVVHLRLGAPGARMDG
jgi:phosphomevalonate kinase